MQMVQQYASVVVQTRVESLQLPAFFDCTLYDNISDCSSSSELNL
jgi:hypothetical protein